MSKIRKSARDKDCEIRIPGICNFNPETTVAAHIRVAGLCGVGSKPSDLLTVRACSDCHDVIDGRANNDLYTMDQIDSMTLEAMCRTLSAYEKEGLVNLS